MVLKLHYKRVIMCLYQVVRLESGQIELGKKRGNLYLL